MSARGLRLANEAIAEGLPNTAIVKSLHLSLKTIETHRKKDYVMTILENR